jgi:hypothetical protein
MLAREMIDARKHHHLHSRANRYVFPRQPTPDLTSTVETEKHNIYGQYRPLSSHRALISRIQ